MVPVYITNLILYSNQNYMNFTIGTLVYSVEMIPGWLGISLECTDICALIKALLVTVSLAEFNTMALNSKISKAVSYIQDKKAWERIYVLLKIIFPCLWVLRLVDSNKSGMDKVFYYAIMKKISIIKSSYDLNNKELLPVSGS